MVETRDSVDLDTLRGLVETARLENERLRLDAENRALRTVSEGWGAAVDRREFLSDGVGMSDFASPGEVAAIAYPSDRDRGDFFPFWQTEVEHRSLVGIARRLRYGTEVGTSAIETLTNYVVGFGFDYGAKARGKGDGSEKWAAIVGRIVDEFLEANRWESDVERQVFDASRVDGDAFLCLEHRGGACVELRVVDGPQVGEPDRPRSIEEHCRLSPGLDWKYGIAADVNRPDRAHAIFVSSLSGDEDWDVYTTDRFVQLKLNVPTLAKRGLSDFYPIDATLGRGNKLLANTLEGAAVQASIAYIREHAPGVTKSKIDQIVLDGSDRSTSTQRVPGGNVRPKNVKNYPSGTVHDVTAGMKYQAGPMGSPNGPRFIEVVQAALRMVGIRWQMPEYLISGDASNGNFSSTLVAESPFVKGCEARQTFYCRRYVELLWKVVAIVQRYTGVFGIETKLRDIRRAVEIVVTPPDVSVRNRVEDNAVRQAEFNAGILSRPTWAAEVGRDFEQEVANGARPANTMNPNVPEWVGRNYP